MPSKNNPTKRELAKQINTYKITGSYKTKKGFIKNQKISYSYVVASREVPKEFIPSGAARRRLTALLDAIYHFLRPIAFQNFSANLPPPALQESNSLGINPVING